MDMANATAAGPSEGLLDILFGSKPKENSETDGKDFTNLLDAIKSLGKKAKETASETAKDEQARWTQVETEAEKDMAERQVVGSPVLALMIGMSEQQFSQAPKVVSQENLGERGSLSEINKSRKPQIQGNGSQILDKQGSQAMAMQESSVNQLLKEQNMEPLDAKEQALLKEINGKLKAIAKNEKKGNSKLEGVGSKEIQGDMVSMESSGLDKQAGTIAATESYLKLRDLASGLQANRGESKSSMKQTIKEVEEGKDVKDMKESASSHVSKKDLEVVLPKNPKDTSFSSSFVATPLAMNDLKSADLEFKEVYLGGVKPNDRAGALMSEVSQSVNFQAMRGGGEMRLVIYPEALGEIHLKVGTKNGKVEVTMTAQNEEIASMIRDGSGDLAGALKENNLELTKFEVNFTEKTFNVEPKIEARDTNPSSMFDQRNQHSMNHQQDGRSNHSQSFQDQEAHRQPDFERGFSEPKTAAVKPMYMPTRSKTTSLDVVA